MPGAIDESGKTYNQWLESLKKGKSPDGHPAEVIVLNPKEQLKLITKGRRTTSRHISIRSWYVGEKPQMVVHKFNELLGHEVTITFLPRTLVAIATMNAQGKVTMKVYHCPEEQPKDPTTLESQEGP